MENFQLACLVIGCVALGISARKAGARPPKVFYIGLALGYFSMAVLEFDVRPFKIEWLTFLSGGVARDLWLGFFWLAALRLFLKQPRPVLEAFKTWLPTSAGVVMVLGGCFWVSAYLMDRLKPFSDSAHNVFAEELLEVPGAALLLLSAVLCLPGVGRGLAAWMERPRTNSD